MSPFTVITLSDNDGMSCFTLEGASRLVLNLSLLLTHRNTPTAVNPIPNNEKITKLIKI